MATIDFDLKCIRCGESLTGLSLSEYCAKCGLTSSDSLNTRVLESATAAVNADVACVGCGYNLRTLGLGGMCPECATPVHKSLRPDDLRFADVRWLKNVRFGLALVGVTFVLEIAQTVLLPLVARFAPPTAIAAYYRSGVHLAVGLGVAVLWCVGLLLITTQEPAKTLDSRRGRLQAWIRILGLLVLVAFLCSTGFTIAVNMVSAGGTGSPLSGTLTWPRICVAMLYLVIAPLRSCFQASAFLCGLFLRNLAVRDRRRKGLYTTLAAVSILYGVVALVCLPVWYLFTTKLSNSNPGSVVASGFFAFYQIAQGVYLLTGLVFGLIGLAAVILARRMITQAIGKQP